MPILDLVEIEQNFRGTIRTLLGMPANSVRRANQFDPPPAGDQATQFATVLIQEIGGMGWDEVTYANVDQDGYGEGQSGSGGFGGDGENAFGGGGSGSGGYGGDISTDVTELITGQRHFVASVQFFRGNAHVQAVRLTALLQSSNGVAALIALGIGLGKIGNPRNLSALVDSFFENRAQMDIEFYMINQEQVDMPTFGSFPTSVTSDS